MDLGDGEAAHVQAVVGVQMAEADGVDVVEAGIPLQRAEGAVPEVKD